MLLNKIYDGWHFLRFSRMRMQVQGDGEETARSSRMQGVRTFAHVSHLPPLDIKRNKWRLICRLLIKYRILLTSTWWQESIHMRAALMHTNGR